MDEIKKLLKMWPFHGLKIGWIHDLWYFHEGGDPFGKYTYYDCVTRKGSVITLRVRQSK
jgi:hypothetical protein